MRFLSEKQRRKGKIYPFECRVPKKARRDKKAFLGDPCKEIEENNRMGKTRYLFQKIRGIKGTFHERTEMIKKRWQEYTEELYKKDLYKNYTKKIFMTQITMMV